MKLPDSVIPDFYMLFLFVHTLCIYFSFFKVASFFITDIISYTFHKQTYSVHSMFDAIQYFVIVQACFCEHLFLEESRVYLVGQAKNGQPSSERQAEGEEKTESQEFQGGAFINLAEKAEQFEIQVEFLSNFFQ